MAKAKSSILNANGLDFLDYPDTEIKQSSRIAFTDMDTITVSQVLSSAEMPSRNRIEIYQQYLYMLSDPIISSAFNLHITQSLGGHETTGDVIFLEAKPNIGKNELGMLEEIRKDLLDLINENAYRIALWGIAFGDSYARLYSSPKKGVEYIEVSDFYLPIFVQSFELGGNTAGYQVSIEDKKITMSPMQLSRLKMPRMGFTPQFRMQYNYLLQSLKEDDLSKHKPIPSTIGGSFCENAEKPFFLLQSALLGMSSGRILDSIRENFIGLNMADMTTDQQKMFFNRLSHLLQSSKKKAEQAIKEKKPIVEKILHILPTWNEKQLYSIDAGGQSINNAQSYTTDDVMFYAKLLAGSLGLDLSLLGFSDILSGGLGDGGFFRISAQSGQRARLIRQAVTGWVNHIIDVHCQQKYGGIFERGNRPYEVVFNGATSALEAENQATRERKSMASATVMQVISMLKEQGADIKTAEHFIKEQMGLDEEDAKIYAQLMQSGQADEFSEEMTEENE